MLAELIFQHDYRGSIQGDASRRSILGRVQPSGLALQVHPIPCGPMKQQVMPRASTLEPDFRISMLKLRLHIILATDYGSGLMLCTVSNIIVCFYDSDLDLHFIRQAFDSTPSGFELPKFE